MKSADYTISMPEIRRAQTRGRLRNEWLDASFSFSFGPYRNPKRDSFGVLVALNEDIIQPGTGFEMHGHQDLEIFIVPLQGAVAHKDSLGNSALVRPGEVQKMTAGAGIEHSQKNASLSELDHHLQIWLRPRTKGRKPGIEQRRFDPAERLGAWQLLISPDGRSESLSVDQDASVFAATVLVGKSLVCVGSHGRSQYLHVVRGEVAVNTKSATPIVLVAGDAIVMYSAMNFELSCANGGAEVLLFDVPEVSSPIDGP